MNSVQNFISLDTSKLYFSRARKTRLPLREFCPGCGRKAYLCWNCGKCPDCVDHRGTFSCLKHDIPTCVLCGEPRYTRDGCVLRSMGVYSGYENDRYLTFWACAECSSTPGVHKRIEAKVNSMTLAEQDEHGSICL